MRSKISALGCVAAMVAGLVVAAPAVADDSDGAVATVADDTDASPYIVVMDAAPAIALEGSAEAVLGGDEAAISERGSAAGDRGVDPDSEAVRSYEAGLEREQVEVVESVAPDAQVTHQLTYAINAVAVSLTDAEVEAMRARKGVARVMQDELLQPQTDTSPTFLELDVRRGAWDSGYTGDGVVVGVIDTGIWPEHASFADDGSYDAPEGVSGVPCDFGDTEHNPDDVAFDCNNKLVGARDMRATYNALIGPETYASARDSDGHGTHTASTAAGNRNVDAEIFGIARGKVSGIAPRASVIAYKGLGDLGGFGSDLAAAIDQAVADGVDVINYSIGSTTPGLSGPDDIAFLFAVNAGVHVASSNGNAGPGPETVGSPASVPWLTAVGASTHDRTFANPLQIGQIGAGGFLTMGTSITEASPQAPLVDAEDLGNELCLPDEGFSEDVTGKIVLCLSGGIVRVAKSQVVADAGGVGMILYNPDDTMSLVTDSHYIPASHVNFTTGSRIKDYIDAAGSDAVAKIGRGEATKTQGSVMAAFSSRGPIGQPASPDIIRPDVTAPGVNILAGNTPIPNLGRPGQLFQSISGPSMSSAHVAGLMALADQAHPDWSPAAVRSSLMTTARQDVTKEDADTPADPFDMGAGHVDPGKPHKRNSMFNPGVVFDAGFADYLAFLCGATADVVDDAACDSLVDVGYSTDASNLNLASIGAADVVESETITRTVTNVSGRRLNLRAHIEEPDGFDVKVSPRRIRVDNGKSVTFEITLTNVSATPDEWTFGALTLKGSGYKARTPIAVSGAAFGAPDEVTGTGASGSLDFPVEFGYTGDYTAAAHGLAPEVLLEGTVTQDPDQTFDPADEGNGATPFDLDLTDTAMFRYRLEPDDVEGPRADEADLDIYVTDATDTVVASSGAGGTDELIEMVLPEPGNYTLWVHGRQTAGQPRDFTGHSWNVPLTANTGSLVIEDAPDAAVAGTTDTVTVSWSGVAPDSTELGAVSHSDADGLLGLTLVQITNNQPGGGDRYDATVRRTRGGIPHILADDYASLGFGTGHAMAEDIACPLAEIFLTHAGERARYLGATDENVRSDHFYQLLIDREEALEPVDERMSELMRGAADGYNRYLRDTGVDELPDAACRGEDWVRPITEVDFRRVMRTNFLLPAIINLIVGAQPPTADSPASVSEQDGLPEAVEEELAALERAPGTGSNGIAIGEDGTVDATGMLLANPHLPWSGTLRFYAFHQTIPGEINVLGANIIGRPMVQGPATNEHVAWTSTVSTAQRSTVYQLQINPDDPTQYRFDDEWRDFTAETVTIEVPDGYGGFKEVSNTFYTTHYGAYVLAGTWGPQVAYALRPTLDGWRGTDSLVEQWQATSVRDLKAVHDAYQFSPSNTIAADAVGETYFADPGPVPNLTDQQLTDCAVPGGLDGSRPGCMWGTDSDAAAPGIFGPSNLPNLIRSDFVANMNNSYWLANPDEPLTGFASVLGSEQGPLSQRARSGLHQVQEQIDQDGFMLPALQELIYGNLSYTGTILRDDLVALCTQNPEVRLPAGVVDIAKACDVLADWDLRFDVDSRGAHLFNEFWREIDGDLTYRVPYDPDEPVETPRGLDLAGNDAALQALATVVTAFEGDGIALDVAWGEVQGVTRNGTYLPIHGGGPGNLNVIRHDPMRGSSWIQTTEFTPDGPDSRGILTYSLSTNPDSPHYADQTRLYSDEQWLDLPFFPVDVAGAAESTVHLEQD